MSRRQPAGQRRYSVAERQEGLALAGQVGFAEAGRQLEIPDGTLRSWARRAAGALEVVTAGVALSPVEAALPWPERRAVLLPRIGEVAAEAVEAAQRAIEAGKGREAQSFAVAAGILIDKAQLLGGGATSRSESTAVRIDASSQRDIAEQVAALQRELGYPVLEVVDAEVVDDGA